MSILLRLALLSRTGLLAVLVSTGGTVTVGWANQASHMETPRFDRPHWSTRDLTGDRTDAALVLNIKQDQESEGEKPVDFAAAVKGMTVYSGLFTLYGNPETGELLMAVRADQLDKSYIYFAHTVEGAPAAGYYRGSYRANQVFSIKKRFRRLEFSAEYTEAYFDPATKLARAASANISPSPLAAPDIKAVSADGKIYLIDAADLFFQETLHKLSGAPDALRPNPILQLEALQEDMTRVHRIGNYPSNMDVVMDYVYEASASGDIPPGVQIRGVADARTVSVRLQHSLIEMPQDGFKTRLDDPRIGYFTERSTDLTSLSDSPYRDLIQRWRLEKRDPDAELSEPVKPIVWWIENTTPAAFRGPIREGVLAWNKAFEAAGFKNAIVVKEQPDTATWDAGDIHYNVIRWVSSDWPPSLGYGPAFTNPLTGEILGADIVLDFSFVTSNRLTDEVYKPKINHARASSKEEAAALMVLPAGPVRARGRFFCQQSDHIRRNLVLGAATLFATNAKAGDVKQLLRESLVELVMHEVGHTLGLTHNMMGSYFHPLDRIHDRKVTEKTGVSASVMDYPAVNLAGPGRKQGQFYNSVPGPYDMWAIEFGYTPVKPALKVEDDWRRALLSRSSKPGFAFGNDADALTQPGNGIDPRIIPYDLSAEPLDYAAERIALGQKTISRLKEVYSKNRSDWQGLYNAFSVLNADFRNSVRIISRYIAGVQIDRALPGQKGGVEPYRPIPRAQQKKAMSLLRTHVFSPQAQVLPKDVLQHLQPRRRGFDFVGEPEDPKLQLIALSNQRAAIDYLLHPATTMRMTDSSLYGNTYSVAEMIEDLVDAAFADEGGGPIPVYRRQLQIDLVYALRIVALGTGEPGQWDFIARSAAQNGLERIWDYVAPTWFGWGDYGLDRETMAHRTYLRLQLRGE